MFKKTMKFDNLSGEEVEQTFYFNFNKKELVEMMEFEQLEEKLKRLTTPTSESGLNEVDNARQAYDTFQDLILRAYGEKGEDNVTFVKNERTREYLKNHVAFVEIIFEFVENPKLAAEFVEKCFPEKLVRQAKAEAEKNGDGESTQLEAATTKTAPREVTPTKPMTDGLTDEEILAKKPTELSHPQLVRAMQLKASS